MYFRTHDIDGHRMVNDNTRDCNSNVCLSLDGGSLNYSSTSDIAGFQIFHNGCISNASEGDATAAGFTVSTSGTVVLGFSFTGSVVAAGDGTLVLLDGEVSQDCMSDFIFSDINGDPLTWEYDDGQPDPVYVADCSDVYADCEFNEYDCTGVCGGSAQEDLCGECLGDNTSCV